MIKKRESDLNSLFLKLYYLNSPHLEPNIESRVTYATDVKILNLQCTRTFSVTSHVQQFGNIVYS